MKVKVFNYMFFIFVFPFCFSTIVTNDNEYCFFFNKELGITKSNLTHDIYKQCVKNVTYHASVFALLFEKYNDENDSVINRLNQKIIVECKECETKENSIELIKKMLKDEKKYILYMKRYTKKKYKETIIKVYEEIYKTINQEYCGINKSENFCDKVDNNKLLNLIITHYDRVYDEKFRLLDKLFLYLNMPNNHSLTITNIIKMIQSLNQMHFDYKAMLFEFLTCEIIEETAKLLEFNISTYSDIPVSYKAFCNLISSYCPFFSLHVEIFEDSFDVINNKLCQDRINYIFDSFFCKDYLPKCYNRYLFLIKHIINIREIIMVGLGLTKDLEYEQMILNVVKNIQDYVYCNVNIWKYFLEKYKANLKNNLNIKVEEKLKSLQSFRSSIVRINQIMKAIIIPHYNNSLMLSQLTTFYSTL